MKNPNDTIGNRTRDLPACSAVLQPNTPPRAPQFYGCDDKMQVERTATVISMTVITAVLLTVKEIGKHKLANQ
jgi:hypothetical protein